MNEMDVEQALSRVDRVADLQWATEAEVVLAAEVRRLREREARARELAEKFIRSMDGATGTIGQAIAATEIRDGLRHWLETE